MHHEHMTCPTPHAHVPADEDDDGLLTFEDFLSSYARERPVFLSLAIMAAHTAAFWIIFNCPLDTLFKVTVVVWRGQAVSHCPLDTLL
jgi:hypothetical protein